MKRKFLQYFSRVNILMFTALVVSVLFLASCGETWIEKTRAVPALYRQLPYNGMIYGWICGVIMFFVFVCIFGGAANHKSVNYLFRLAVFIVPLATLHPLFAETRFFMRHHVYSNVIEVADAIAAPGWWVSLCLAICLVVLLEMILFLVILNEPRKHKQC